MAPPRKRDDRRPTIRRPRHRVQRGQARAEIGDRHGAEQLWGASGGVRRGGQKGHRASGPTGAVQERACGFHPAGPLGCRGPAIVDHQQGRAGSSQRGARIQDRTRQGQDHECRGDQTQQQQPPWRAGRGFLGGMQSQQQADGREILAAWRRRSDAQQPPQHRQGGQRGQRPGHGKDHRSPNAVYSDSSAVSGGWSVRCTPNPKFAAEQIAANPSCWAFNRAI